MAALGYSRDGFAVESRWADRSIGSRKVGKGGMKASSRHQG